MNQQYVTNKLLSDFIPKPQSLEKEAFLKLKTNLELNPSFDDIIQQKHNAVRSVIENLGIKDTKLIGSLQRKTRIQPKTGQIFDIDILVILGDFVGWNPLYGGIAPRDAMNFMHSMIRKSERYDAMNPAQNQPAVLFEYKDGVKVELVPAYRDKVGRSPNGITHSPIGRGYWVPKNGTWTLADYDYDANFISASNSVSDGWLVPTVKMLKAIKKRFFPQIDSYHIEVLAADIIPTNVRLNQYFGIPTSYPQLITSFFDFVGDRLLTPVSLRGSNSPSVSLDVKTWLSVCRATSLLKNYCNYTRSLPKEQERVKAWRLLFDEDFPAD